MADNYRKLSVSADQIEDVVEYISENRYTIDQKLNEVQNNMHDIEEIQTEIANMYNKTEADNLLSAKADKSSVYTKTETESKITEKVSEIVAGAPSDFDTLKEMSDWLTEHEESAAAMNSAIQGKVDKETGKSLMTDTEITRLAGVDNYDDSNLKNDIVINKTTLGMQCKNLLKNEAATETKNGVTFTVNTDGTITINGTCTADYNHYCGEIKKPGKYIINGYPENAVFDDYRIMGRITKSDNTETWFSAELEQPITINATNISVKIYIKVKTNVTYENVVFLPMVRYADVTDNTYEPYVDNVSKRLDTIETNVTCVKTNTESMISDIYNRCGGGKNLFDFKNAVNSENVGNTYTKNDDSISITKSSSAYARTGFQLCELPVGRYCVSFLASDLECEKNTPKVLISKTKGGTDAIGASDTITENKRYTFYFNVTASVKDIYIIFYGNYNNSIYNNKLTISEIMIYPDYIKDPTFTPYIPTNAELQEQINALVSRIAALEGTTTTAEGGEA